MFSNILYIPYKQKILFLFSFHDLHQAGEISIEMSLFRIQFFHFTHEKHQSGTLFLDEEIERPVKSDSCHRFLTSFRQRSVKPCLGDGSSFRSPFVYPENRLLLENIEIQRIGCQSTEISLSTECIVNTHFLKHFNK